MGLFTNSVFLGIGIGIGVYMAQNYNLPSAKAYVDYAIKEVKRLSEEYKKDEKR